MSERKILVIDTSVLLYDKESIHSFPGTDVVIPITVLDELDRFKEKAGLLGESARYVNRFLDFLRQKGRLDKGILIEEEDQTIRVMTTEPQMIVLDDTRGDNKIIAAALYLKSQNEGLVKVITKDINLRVKCDALGLEAEDYYKDYIVEENLISEASSYLKVSDEEVDELYESGSLKIENKDAIDINSYHVVEGPSTGKSALCFYKKNTLFLLNDKNRSNQTDVKPRNKEQRFALHALRDSDVPLVCLTGLAGSGKTFLALTCGLEELLEKKYERIVVTRNIEPVGRDIGFLPGDINEKMAPWMAPLLDNFRHHFKDKTYFKAMIEKGEIEIAPLSFIRGRSFNNVYLIVDEAQNATIHELKTIVTRIGEGSKIVLMGDTDQIDTPYIDKRSNGLSIVIDKFRQSDLTTHVHLSRGERSALATYASKVL